MRTAFTTVLFPLLTSLTTAALAATPVCEARSGERLTPVIELYTSEGCSSCPPADQWLSTLKGKPVVAQAFHVGYWDYIGWVDRFANAAHTQRQREVAQTNHLSSIYTPQLVRNGQDWRDWRRPLTDNTQAARASIAVQRAADGSVTAQVAPAAGVAQWSAYWTVTEDGHSSKVKAGENAGELLQHDFVVRQYVPLGRYQGAQTLRLAAIAPTPGHAQHINLVVSDAQSQAPLQALTLSCPLAAGS